MKGKAWRGVMPKAGGDRNKTHSPNELEGDQEPADGGTIIV